VISGVDAERRWARLVKNFLQDGGRNAAVVTPSSGDYYLYLTDERLYCYNSSDNGAPHLLEVLKKTTCKSLLPAACYCSTCTVD
jgi:hypothetical protein